MATYPQSTSGLSYITYPAGPTAAALTLTANAAAHTKGTYAQFVASTTFASNSVHVEVPQTVASANGFLFDIATGAAASEVVVIPNILAEGCSTSTSLCGAESLAFNLSVAGSTRLSARCQCTTGGLTMAVALTLIAAGSVPGITSFTNDGANTATSTGVSIDPGGTANTKGAYTQLSASTGAVTQFYALSMTTGSNTTRANDAIWAIDLATGAGGAEVVLVPDLRSSSGTGGLVLMLTMVPRAYSDMIYIAASTRTALRASCSTNNATDRLFKAAMLSGTAPSEVSSTVTDSPALGCVAS